jgi:succinate dehydrogenase/fumarate reductase flavoprotein subunit
MNMQTDVLVIGAGGAGLVAAIAARRAGAEVTLLSKTSTGLGGCTAYAGGGFTLAAGKVSPADHRARTWEIGRRLNQESLLNVLSGEGEQALRELAAWGITIRVSDGHATVRDSAPTPIMGGAGFTRELAAIARDSGVRIVQNVVATELLVDEGHVRGAHMVDWQSGRETTVAAGAVILATGGAGQIYHRTDNPARVTGDGYALALQAGLPLMDMEFVQFYPLGWAEPTFPQWMIGLPILDHAKVTDQDGDEFLLRAIHDWGLKNGREANLYARDRSAQLVGRKWHEDGQVYLHLEQVEPTVWQLSAMQELLAFYPQDVSPAEYGPVKVAPIEHYFTGGVVIDVFGHTAIPGLYACGEVTGGVDGASRIGGNALTNLVTFGLRAGRAAAAERQAAANVPPGQSLRTSPSGARPEDLRQQIKNIAETGAGPVRNAIGMAQAIAELDEMVEPIASPLVASARDRLLALELPGLWWSARAVLQAALAREESRGVHFRTDFPDELPAWQRNILVRWLDGRMKVEI